MSPLDPQEKLVLIVDDEADLVEVLKVRVRGWGYRVAAARDGEEAIQEVGRERPDLILLDYMLPRMNGL